MKSLSKAQRKRRDEVAKSLRTAAEHLEAAVAQFNAQLADEQTAVRAALDAYNSAVTDAEEYRAEIAAQASDYFDERSEQWQEGDNGDAYRSFMEDWDGAELSEISIDFPDEIECPELDHADTLDNLPEAPE